MVWLQLLMMEKFPGFKVFLKIGNLLGINYTFIANIIKLNNYNFNFIRSNGEIMNYAW